MREHRRKAKSRRKAGRDLELSETLRFVLMPDILREQESSVSREVGNEREFRFSHEDEDIIRH